MTVAEVIAELTKLPAECPVFFDCPNCGRANEMSHCDTAVVVHTRREKTEQP